MRTIFQLEVEELGRKSIQLAGSVGNSTILFLF